MIDLDRTTNDQSYEQLAYCEQDGKPEPKIGVAAWLMTMLAIGVVGFALCMSIHKAPADGVVNCSFMGGVACVWHDGTGGGLGAVVHAPPTGDGRRQGSGGRTRAAMGRTLSSDYGA